MPHPQIIQGGMGVAVSGWRLARAVSQSGQLGVVSGTALAVVMSRRLQHGDPEGHVRRALAHFPVPAIAARIVDAFYIPGGKAADKKFKSLPLPTPELHPDLLELTIAANFAEVFLAKEDHGGVVGINYLEKIQIPTLASIYGAMLAGVDYILMGAGIPRHIPGVIDCFSQGKPASIKLDAQNLSSGREIHSTFDPATLFAGSAPPAMKRPFFLGIVSSATLAMTLARKSNGRVDGFVVEASCAGGHNAPPRGPLQFNDRGEPIYGERDLPDFARYRELGLPFWLAGSYGQEGGLKRALDLGATGIQVGTAFAFCEESGIDPILKARVIEHASNTVPDILTDPLASPTGFPFKVLQLEGTISEAADYNARTRVCDLGYLRTMYEKPDGSIGYRCAAEPVDQYVRKGGALDDTIGRKCICNALVATAGMGQVIQNGGTEKGLVTAGDHLADIARFVTANRRTYTAADVIRSLLASEVPQPKA